MCSCWAWRRGTKLLTFLVGCDKEYRATIRLGQTTVTDDAEGEPTASVGVADPAAVEAALPAAVARLTGEIEQVPSAVSAIKVDGERSYATVRKGGAVDLPARPVTVSRFDVHSVAPTTATLEDGRPSMSWMSRSRSRCRRARTCGRSRATSALRSASADT